MATQAIDNTNLKNYVPASVIPAGFTPAVSYTYNAATGDVVVTDASVIPAGDTLRKVKIQIFDKFGGELRGAITVTGAPGAQTINALALNRSKPLDIKVTVLTANQIAADGGAYNIGAGGNLSQWDIQQNA